MSSDGARTPVAHFESFAEGRGWHASFGELQRQRYAYALDEVLPLLRDAEAAAREGMWVALALSYESAPAFDSALHAKPLSGFPFAWMGVFREQLPHDGDPASGGQCQLSHLDPEVDKAQYGRAIDAIRSYIENGDTYQVNFTFPMRGKVSGDLFHCFRSIAELQGAAYSAYLDMGTHKILSFSPELFVERRGNTLLTRPMKGTLARGRWLEEDRAHAELLKESLKDRAENVMIVDLLRSDLGKVAEIGSVKVPELFVVERLGRVLQMTSGVTAVPRPGVSVVDVLQALFPCGSITGAPKARTMAIIDQLEKYPRGIYTGAIGFLSPTGDFVLNVAIRTLVVEAESGAATFNVGGGITWDSTARDEYEECHQKAQFLTNAWPEFDLLETMELNGGEYTLLERHLARARDSAAYFGHRWSDILVLKALEEICESHPVGRWRVRLLVDKRGNPNAEAHALSPTLDRPLGVRFASCPIDDRDALIFHKTTARSNFSVELERCQPCDDVVFWNCRGEVTESSIANIVVFTDGKNWTPPRNAGLLAGTFRDELISRGELFERTITKGELESLGKFHLINSVRGWMSAQLS
jgi:para-aminobenzoate synthetase / 4-amino-4-deoxychorismate lyase